MTFSQRLIVNTFTGITNLICRIDADQLENVPKYGPLIIYTNHVNILEIPIIYTRLQPRRVHGMLLAERWKIPVLNWVLDVTETIPLQRGEADIDAFRRALDELKKGDMLIIAPEGTRSHDGTLQSAHPGVVLLALHSGAPLIPVAYYGAENYTQNLSRLKRTDFYLRVGKPFRIDFKGEKVTRLLREKIVEEMMYQLASLLPQQYRGQFSRPPTTKAQYITYD